MDQDTGGQPDEERRSGAPGRGAGAGRGDPLRPGGTRPKEPGEGVRIIGADEAAEAIERGDVVKRRGDDMPRFGDRPPPPPEGGPRPTLRFPLSGTADPTAVERPPIVPPPAPAPPAGPVGATSARNPARNPAPEPAPEPVPAEPVLDPTGDLAAGWEDDLVPGQPLPDDDEDNPFVARPTTGSTPLPPWTDPPTGEVPRVLADQPLEEGDDDLAAWSSFAASGGPRWRDQPEDWDEGDFDPTRLADDDELRLGALDPDRPSTADLYDFDDPVPRGEPAPAPADRRRAAREPRGRRGATRRVGRADPAGGPATGPVPVPPVHADPSAGRGRPAAVAPGDPGAGRGRPVPGDPGAGRGRPAAVAPGDPGAGRGRPVPGDPSAGRGRPAVVAPGDPGGGRGRPAAVAPGDPGAGRGPVTGDPGAGRGRPGASAVPPPGGRQGRPVVAGDPTIGGARPAAAAAAAAADPYVTDDPVADDPAVGPAPSRSGRAGAAERRARAAAAANANADPGAPIAPGQGTRRGATARVGEGATGAGPRRVARGGPGGPGRNGGQGAGRDVPIAIAVGALFAAVALILFKVGPRATMVLVTAVLVVAAVEFFSAARQGGYQPAVLLGLAATAAMALAAYWRGEAAYPLVIFLTVVFGMLWHLVGAGEDERPVPNLGVTLLGVAYVGGLGSFAALLLKFPNGIGMLLGAVIATVAYDVGGYAVGRNLGRAPLAPDVSPNKTWEGLIGGIALTVIATTLIVGRFPGIHPFDTLGDALKLGLVAAVAAPLGDLCESMLKRDLGVKDMGSTLPAHGGLLDRFDALLFVLPATYYLVRLLDLA